MHLNHASQPRSERRDPVTTGSLGLSPLTRRALLSVVVDGPQPIDLLAERLGASVESVGSAARALVVRGAAVRVPRGSGLPMLVASTGGSAIVRDALTRESDTRPAP